MPTSVHRDGEKQRDGEGSRRLVLPFGELDVLREHWGHLPFRDSGHEGLLATPHILYLVDVFLTGQRAIGQYFTCHPGQTQLPPGQEMATVFHTAQNLSGSSVRKLDARRVYAGNS